MRNRLLENESSGQATDFVAPAILADFRPTINVPVPIALFPGDRTPAYRQRPCSPWLLPAQMRWQICTPIAPRRGWKTYEYAPLPRTSRRTRSAAPETPPG